MVRPTATELVEAVREFLETDVLPATEGRVKYQTRVAINVLGMVERELAQGPAEPRDDAELAAAIRSGALDDRFEEVRAMLLRSVRAQLDVANPGYR